MSNQLHIKIVLVNTSHPGNIGATARAMKNMGLSRLTLVNPVEFPSGVSVGRAASALNVLEQAEVVGTLSEAIADCTLVIGSSARSRSLPWPMLTPEQSASKIVTESKNAQVALIFGREDSGLNNEELQLCHYHVQIPASDQYSSLNLAAAAMVLCYEIRKAVLRDNEEPGRVERDYWDQEKASVRQVEYFYEHLERVLVEIEFHDRDNPRQLMQRIRRLFGRVRIDSMEMNILRGILTNIEQKIRSLRG
ncbi:MAG TPA: tRNA (cytosine(32)/uridine(32)-2'-O)-methyltransferase TrmJ [Gammaproteobacteria bacterium]|nr:tRNA (cytosine(32)/uridine(32)-2'-O)-methyltransferase TrmJ [Gammaproteobacteria bacterium]|tara:strand:+ start:4179 stop:4928 length:750 start_codon:yes stop_codon:yes gene_type:complete